MANMQASCFLFADIIAWKYTLCCSYPQNKQARPAQPLNHQATKPPSRHSVWLLWQQTNKRTNSRTPTHQSPRTHATRCQPWSVENVFECFHMVFRFIPNIPWKLPRVGHIELTQRAKKHTYMPKLRHLNTFKCHFNNFKKDSLRSKCLVVYLEHLNVLSLRNYRFHIE